MLRLIGMLGAGDPCNVAVSPGTAVRALSGAPIPQGLMLSWQRNSLKKSSVKSEPWRAWSGEETSSQKVPKSAMERSLSRQERCLRRPRSLAVAGAIEEVSVFSFSPRHEGLSLPVVESHPVDCPYQFLVADESISFVN